MLRALRFRQCPLPLRCFRFDPDAHEFDEVHVWALATLRQMAQTRAARASLGVLATIWPVRLLIEGIVAAWRKGGDVQRAHGIRRGRQLRRLLELAWTRNIAPYSFYEFRLWDDSRSVKAALFVQDQEMYAVQMWLNRSLDTRPIDDKLCFFDRCRAYGLPAAPLIAAFRDGRPERRPEAEPSAWPACDLFVKYTTLSGGVGAEGWNWDAAGSWYRNNRRLDGSSFVRYCLERSRARRLVVQRRLVNHPATARFSLGGLCTLRVVTYRPPDQAARVGVLCLRMPTGRSEVDNFAAGGIVAAVDSDTGLLTAAVRKHAAIGNLTHHPETGARIEGEVLDHWREMVDLALRAHDRFLEPWSIGWDIAMTPDGPVLVEGNTRWGVDLLQMTGRALGETALAPALLAELARVRAPASKTGCSKTGAS